MSLEEIRRVSRSGNHPELVAIHDFEPLEFEHAVRVVTRDRSRASELVLNPAKHDKTAVALPDQVEMPSPFSIAEVCGTVRIVRVMSEPYQAQC